MARANAAYYAACDPYHDFTTSPEITQVFGEILGLWAAVTWDLIGRPNPVLLVECGPGRGTLMADALRAVAQVAPAFGAAARLHLIETSPRLRALQAERLPGAFWHHSLDPVPPGPMLLLANEFLDALPIRQFVRRDVGWMERFVKDGQFVEQSASPSDRSPPPLVSMSPHRATIHEVNEPALAIAQALGTRFTVHPGAALFLDYGPEQAAWGDSLQALRDGRPADPLGTPGTADLTAHVDFAAFAAAARDAGAVTHGPIPQGVFLTRLGLFQRTGRLARGLPPARALSLTDAARRLAEPNRMGRLFTTLALCSPGFAEPPGFSG